MKSYLFGKDFMLTILRKYTALDASVLALLGFLLNQFDKFAR